MAVVFVYQYCSADVGLFFSVHVQRRTVLQLYWGHYRYITSRLYRWQRYRYSLRRGFRFVVQRTYSVILPVTEHGTDYHSCLSAVTHTVAVFIGNQQRPIQWYHRRPQRIHFPPNNLFAAAMPLSAKWLWPLLCFMLSAAYEYTRPN